MAFVNPARLSAEFDGGAEIAAIFWYGRPVPESLQYGVRYPTW